MGGEGYIPESVIERVRQESDIVALISSYLSLKKVGQNYKGLCPFHAEKTPSFLVSPTKQMFHCFGCGEGGSIFHFLMKMESLNFPESVRFLGKRLGIPLPEKGDPIENRQAIEERERVRRIHEDACEHFRRLLMSHPGAERARGYLKSRGIGEQAVTDFSLGFALPQWNDLVLYLERKGWKRADLECSGLILSGQHGLYDRFRGRVTFPIFDSQNRIIGFGGRTLDESTPKYLNSPESVLFQKGRHLYAFERAKGVIGEQPLVVVEGYFDVIAAHQAGIRNVVGTLGTALTPYHLQLVRRFTKEVVLLFDSDSAGHKAMVRAAEIILGGDWVVRVVALPEGEDPDSFIRRVGKEVFETYVQKAIPLMDFVVQSYLTDRPALGIQDKVQMSRHLFPYIAKLSSHLEQGYYLKQLAERLDVSEQDLVAEYREASRKGETRKVVSTLTERTAYPKDEEILCHLLLHGKIEGERLRPLLEGFSDSRLRGVVQAILEVLETGGKADVDKILHLCSGTQEEVQFLSGLMLRELEYDDVKKTAEDCLATVYRRWIQRQLKATERAIASAEKEGDLEAVRNLQRSIIQLRGRTRPDTALTQQPYAV